MATGYSSNLKLEAKIFNFVVVGDCTCYTDIHLKISAHLKKLLKLKPAIMDF